MLRGERDVRVPKVFITSYCLTVAAWLVLRNLRESGAFSTLLAQLPLPLVLMYACSLLFSIHARAQHPRSHQLANVCGLLHTLSSTNTASPRNGKQNAGLGACRQGGVVRLSVDKLDPDLELPLPTEVRRSTAAISVSCSRSATTRRYRLGQLPRATPPSAKARVSSTISHFFDELLGAYDVRGGKPKKMACCRLISSA